MVDAYPRKFFNNETIVNSTLFACGRGTTARLYDCQNHKWNCYKTKVAFAVKIFIRPFGMRKFESKRMSCVRVPHIMNAIDMLLLLLRTAW